MSDLIKFESLGPELLLVEAEIKGEIYLKELPIIDHGITWGGAGVIISEINITSSLHYVLVSKYAREIAWYFNRIRDTAYENNMIDYNSKFIFYEKLAREISNYEQEKKNLNRNEILLELLSITKKIAINWDSI
jgi:hypothetical protein